MVGFIFGGDTQETPESLKRKREVAAALIGRAASAPRNVGEGLSAIGNALIYRGLVGDVEKGEAAGRKSAEEVFAPVAAMLGGGSPATPSSAPSMPAPGAAAEMSATDPAAYRDAIASIESAGSGGYSAVGPTDPKLGRALGRYQVMEANIGPWSKEALGREVTPDEFLADPKIQDAVFDKKFGSYVSQYGPERAAQAWFGGPGGVGKVDRQDSLGTSVGEYGNKFTKALGGNAQVAQALTAPQQQQQADTGAIMKALSNPFLSQGQRAVAQALLERELGRQNATYEQQLKQADPAYQLGLEKDRLELDNLRNPKISPADQANIDLNRDKFNFEKGKPNEVGGRLIGNDGKVIYEPPKDPMKVGAKETVIDPTTGKVIYQPTPGTTVADFNDVSSLRKEIQQLPSYKNYSQALPIYRSMAETAGRSSKASDLNLVYGLGKIMDPTSVVREGEMVMVKNTASLPDWLQGAISSLNGGGALAPATREAIMREAYGRVQGYDQAFQQDAGQYRGIVDRNKFNPADVIPDFGTYEPWKAPAAAPENPLPPTPGAIGTDWQEVSPGVRIRKKVQ